MKIRGYKVRALFKKDAKLSIKNKNIIAILLLPIFFSVLYTYMFGDMFEEDLGGFGSIFVIMLAEIVAISAIPLSVQGMSIAEEKEKNTMRTLMLSDITSAEFLLSKTLVTIVYMLVLSVLNFLICKQPLEHLFIFLILSLFTSIGVIFFGSMGGILAKDQTSASTLTTPFMLLFMVPSLFANFNSLFATIARIVPTYAFQLLYEQMVQGTYVSMDNFINIGIILVWIVLGIVAFQYAYRKNLRDN